MTLTDEPAFRRLVDRIDARGARWIERPIAHEAAELSGKVGGKLADPSGNVIEIKYYADRAALLAGAG